MMTLINYASLFMKKAKIMALVKYSLLLVKSVKNRALIRYASLFMRKRHMMALIRYSLLFVKSISTRYALSFLRAVRMMTAKKIRSFILLFAKSFLNLVLIFQLAIWPTISQANPPVQSRSSIDAEDKARLERARQFNAQQVASLREYFVRPQDNRAGLYQNHPLDNFGLLGQEALYQSRSLRKKTERLNKQNEALEELRQQSLALDEVEKAKILQSLKEEKEIPEWLKKRAIELIKLSMEAGTWTPPKYVFYTIGNQTSQNIQTSEFVGEQYIDQILEKLASENPVFTNIDKEYLLAFFKQEKTITEDERYIRIEKYEKLQAEVGFEQAKMAQRQMVHNIRNTIRHTNLLVEIVQDSDQNNKSEEKVVAVLAHPDRQNLANTLTDSDISLSSVFMKSDNSKKSFRLSFQGNIIQTFPQNIEWMAFFENYLVFLEASKVRTKKASLSFIDLNFFERAIGHKALGIFQIPVDLQAVNTSKSKLLSAKIAVTENTEALPDVISSEIIPEKLLQIGSISLSKSQLDYLSALQQMHFNATVALLNPATVKNSQEYLREWVATGMENLKLDVTEQNLPMQQISKEVQAQALIALEKRQEIGVATDASGNYGALNSLALKLPEDSQLTPEQLKISQDFKTALVKDPQFQASLASTHQVLTAQEHFLKRYFVYLYSLTRPQPMGSPSIKKSLALIANSVSLKGDSVENRFEFFKEALKQATYPKNNRKVSVAVLAGLAGVASPEVASFYTGLLNAVSDGAKEFWELTTITTKTSFEWVSLDNIYQSYLAGDKKYNLLKGLVALAGAFVVSLGILHTGVKSVDYVKTLRSKKEQEHREKVNGLFAKFKQSKQDFIDYVEQDRQDFLKNLSRGERAKLGILTQFSFGQNNIQSAQDIKTGSGYSDLVSALKEDKISLELEIDKKFIIKLEKVEPTESLAENQLSISMDEVKTVWTGKPADIKLLLDENQMKPDLNIEIKITGENLHIVGDLVNRDFSNEDHEKVNKARAQVEMERGKDVITESLADKEINTLKQALLHLMIGNSSWTQTVKVLGLSWNWFFLSRNLILSPVTALKMIWYKKYLNIVLTEKHIPTVFNGGGENRLEHAANLFSGVASAKEIKDFEKQTLELERQVREEVRAQAYLKTLELSVQLFNAGNISQREFSQVQSESNKTLKAVDIKNGKLRMFYSIYERELFKQVMRDILLQHIGRDSSRSDANIKADSLAQFVKEGSKLNVAPKQIELFVKDHSPELAQKALQATNNLVEGFLKRVATWSENKSQKLLNPESNMQLERFTIAKDMLNKPEALARATRQFLAEMIVDTPIALLYSFLFLAGVDQGILLMLHDQAFTEEAWFHLSRYVIWNGFFASVMVNILAGTWMKVQMDTRLDASGGFNLIPNKREAKGSFLKYVLKQFGSKNNSLWENQKFAVKLAYVNFVSGTILIGTMWVLTLGRFDLELFLAGYLIYVVTPFMALDFKLENVAEKSFGYSLSPLINAGLDLKGEDQKLRAHPSVLEFATQESNRRRRQFNFWRAIVYGNPAGNMIDIFQNIDTSAGSRGLVRMFSGGALPTEHFVNFMDFLEKKNIVGSGFAESCKSIFTNNRTDL